uniref:HMA domain-containing protein n=1 Tax=Oryza barthii TaxID=65489 RepID=A0A0D3FVD4_9ORYZ
MGASILVITVDLKCCRCRAKITKVLDCLKEEYCIEKTEFEEKDDKVIVRGNFDAGSLRNKICCKAGGKVVKDIKTVDAWPPPKSPEKKKKDEKPVCKLVPFPVPYPAPPPPAAIWPPQPSFYYYPPPPCGGYKFACEENSDVCVIM